MLVVGTRSRFILESTLLHVVAPVARPGARVDYFVRLARTWNERFYGKSLPEAVPGPFQNASDAELRSTVVRRAVEHGASLARATLLDANEQIDPIPLRGPWRARLYAYPPVKSKVGRNVLRRYKAVEMLWNETLAEVGADAYSHVLLARDDSYWFRDLNLSYFPDPRRAYTWSCNIPNLHLHDYMPEYTRIMGIVAAKKLMTLYSDFYRRLRPFLESVHTCEHFLHYVSLIKGVRWSYEPMLHHVAKYADRGSQGGQARVCLRHYRMDPCEAPARGGREAGACWRHATLTSCGYGAWDIPGCLNLLTPKEYGDHLKAETRALERSKAWRAW